MSNEMMTCPECGEDVYMHVYELQESKFLTNKDGSMATDGPTIDMTYRGGLLRFGKCHNCKTTFEADGKEVTEEEIEEPTLSDAIESGLIN